MEITLLCEVMGSLPSAGGLFDQRWSHVKLMQKVLQARQKINEDELEDMASKRRAEDSARRMK